MTPFLKWPGGKARLARRILRLLLQRGPIGTYYEPFVGGGAVFFAAAAARLFRRAVLGDRHPDLVNVYRVVRDELGELVRHLERRAPHAKDEAYFYALRDADTSRWSPVERAARTLYLNRTCFNGLHRVNRAGRFNVPFGRYTSPRVLDVPLLEAAAGALQGVELVEADFETTCARARAGDAIYADPPYLPVSSSSFVAYSGAFTVDDHARLVAALVHHAARGATCVLSSSDTPTARALVAGVGRVRRVRVQRSIGAASATRRHVGELLVSVDGTTRARMRAARGGTCLAAGARCPPCAKRRASRKCAEHGSETATT